jgi:hypothetical protein
MMFHLGCLIPIRNEYFRSLWLGCPYGRIAVTRCTQITIKEISSINQFISGSDNMYPYNYGSACPRWKLSRHSCLNIVSIPKHSRLLHSLPLPRTIPDLFDLEAHHSHLPFTPYVGVTVPRLFSTAVFDRILTYSWRGFWVRKSMVQSVWTGRLVHGSHLLLVGQSPRALPIWPYSSTNILIIFN